MKLKQTMVNKRYHKLFPILGAIVLTACGTPKEIAYFQDMTADNSITLSEATVITVQPDDKISIIVNSRDPQLTQLFNLPYVTRYLSGSTSTYGSGNQGVSGYTVDSNGDIDFPILGKINVGGKTREQIAEQIKNELVQEDLVKDPVVTVEFMNLCISVLGEVNNPGRFDIDRDKMTVLDALSMAGDLTIYGNRTNILVMRQEGEVQKSYSLDLTSGGDIFSSPAYYLQQNDIVYVEPNKVRARQSTVNGNNIRSTSFWLSLASLLTSVAILVLP